MLSIILRSVLFSRLMKMALWTFAMRYSSTRQRSTTKQEVSVIQTKKIT